MAGNLKIKVAVRICPLENETQKDIIEVHEDKKQLTIRGDDNESFTFNEVFSSKTTQAEIYNRSVKPVICNILKGYNVAILAHGQTGSGKTHTMGMSYSGEWEMGVIPRTIIDIFEIARDHFSYDCKITVSFLEIYNELIYDLLAGKPKEQCLLDDILEDSQNGVYVSGQTEISAKSAREVLDLLKNASRKMATGVTPANNSSSLSHAVFTVNVSMTHKSDRKENRKAKLQLVDLAGSDKIDTLGKKRVNIIKNGYLELENLIHCLADRGQKSSDTPYYESKITRLLKDPLGGNCITLLLACVNPSETNIKESLATLRLADKVQNIQNIPTINQESNLVDTEAITNNITVRTHNNYKMDTKSYLEEAEDLRKQISCLEAKLKELNSERKTIQEKISKCFNTKRREKHRKRSLDNVQSNKENEEIPNQFNDCDILEQTEEIIQLIMSYKEEIKSSNQKNKQLEEEYKNTKKNLSKYKEKNMELEVKIKKLERLVKEGSKPKEISKEDEDIDKSPVAKKKQKTNKTEKGDSAGASAKQQSSRGCNCKTDCSRKNCRCNKSGKGCTAACKCLSNVCKNRDLSEEDANQ